MGFALLDEGRAEPEEGGPAPDRIVSGAPRFTTWNDYESPDGKRFAGTWRSTPGAWRVRYDEWEYCEILDGVSVITRADGQSWTVRKGDRFVLDPGFGGVWEVVETTTKRYVVILP